MSILQYVQLLCARWLQQLVLCILIIFCCSVAAPHLRGIARAIMSAKKRPKQGGPAGDAPRATANLAKEPLRLPEGTRVTFARRTTETDDGTEAMACVHGVVVNDGGDRVDAPAADQLQLRYYALVVDEQDVLWWEDTCNIYEVIFPSLFAPSENTCEGIRRAHFKPDAGAAFQRKVEVAKSERAWLDVDAGRVHDQRAVTLTPRVQGILSYSTAPHLGSSGLRHYLLLHSADLRACNAAFYDMRCTSDATTQARSKFNGSSADTPLPVRCDYCQCLFEDVVSPQVRKMKSGIATKAAAAAAAGKSPPTTGKTRNDLLTRRQVQEKMADQAAVVEKLRKSPSTWRLG